MNSLAESKPSPLKWTPQGSRLRADLGIIAHPVESSRQEAARAEAEASLGSEQASAAWIEGEAWSVDQAAEYATLSVTTRGPHKV